MGNASGFVEPLEATSLGMICTQAQALAEMLRADDLRINPSLVKHYDLRISKNWEQIVSFLAVHFRFNTRSKHRTGAPARTTPSWARLRKWSTIIERSARASSRETLLDYHDQFGMEGYLSMLVGQGVPYKNPYHPCDEERANWAQHSASRQK